MSEHLPDHGSNSYNNHSEDQDLDRRPINYSGMTYKELNACIDSDLLKEAVRDVLEIPPCCRSAAIKDFEEADPVLGAKLRLEFLFIQG